MAALFFPAVTLERRIGESGVLLIFGVLAVAYVVLAVWVIRRWSRKVAPRRRSIVAKATMVAVFFAPGLVVHHGVAVAPWWLVAMGVLGQPRYGPMDATSIADVALEAVGLALVPAFVFWLGCLVFLFLVRMAEW